MATPDKLRIRMYNVGFGDCFLLTFFYEGSKPEERHVLIDFGSTAAPENRPSQMALVAKNIEATTGGRLDAVIATHRHADHISGFTTSKGKGTGDVIARIAKNALVVQPWTEEPKLAKNATAPASVRAAKGERGLALRQVKSLESMHDIAASIVRSARRLDVKRMDAENEDERIMAAIPVRDAGVGSQLRARLGFIGETNLKNDSAVRNLMSMSKQKEYLYYGAKTKLEKVLPGVKVHVLGPPTADQHKEILKERSKDPSEFWQMAARAAEVTAQPQSPMLFPRAKSIRGATVPKSVRWFVRRLRAVQAQQMLELVRIIDSAMNNTSLILLFEIGSKLVLFPGDAQIENWEYALKYASDRSVNLARLKKVTLYKVGHHGSLNATPKTLWKLIGKRAKLVTLMSTRPGKHGNPKAQTEVPRSTLVAALKKSSQLHSTAALRGRGVKALYDEVTI